MSQLIIYTDGASRGNPGPGGYGVVMIWGKVQKELSQGYRNTTNNRMELMGVIAALEALNREGLDIILYTDSQYVVNAIEKGWLWNWQRTNFKDKKNRDLWERLIPLLKRHKIRFQWVKGHATNEGNIRCDQLATQAADNGPHLADWGFKNDA